MTKLHVRFGTVDSGKTLRLLSDAYQYQKQGKRPYLIKPTRDTRNKEIVWSRIEQISRPCDLFLHPHEDVPEIPSDVKCIFVDEVQFFTSRQIEQLAVIAQTVPVICYGLRTNFKKKLFPAIITLTALMHEVQFIKSLCSGSGCDRMAMFNMRLHNGVPVFTGDSIETGTHYKGVCDKCYDAAFAASVVGSTVTPSSPLSPESPSIASTVSTDV